MRGDPTVQGTVAVAKPRAIDYIALAKPELTLLSVATAVCGGYLAGPISGTYIPLLYVFLGTLLVGSGAGALNQYLERSFDAMMRRTTNRPVPSGRIRPGEALLFGSCTAALGVGLLLWKTNALAAMLSLATLTTYILLYTPLKRLTPAATFVGGVPGALPPVIGWTAVRGGFGYEPVVLFALLYFWQMPHFLSLAWIYRSDYGRAGYRLLPVNDPTGKKTAWYVQAHALAMIFASFMPVFAGMATLPYSVAAAALGVYFLFCTMRFWRQRTNAVARTVFAASLIYLPAIMTALVIFRE